MATEEDQKPILAAENDDYTTEEEDRKEIANPVKEADDVRGPNITTKLPWGAILLDRIGLFNFHTRKR